MLASDAAECMWVSCSSCVGTEQVCAHTHERFAKRAKMDQCHFDEAERLVVVIHVVGGADWRKTF